VAGLLRLLVKFEVSHGEKIRGIIADVIKGNYFFFFFFVFFFFFFFFLYYNSLLFGYQPIDRSVTISNFKRIGLLIGISWLCVLQSLS